jgi:hypothetical protein
MLALPADWYIHSLDIYDRVDGQDGQGALTESYPAGGGEPRTVACRVQMPNSTTRHGARVLVVDVGQIQGEREWTIGFPSDPSILPDTKLVWQGLTLLSSMKARPVRFDSNTPVAWAVDACERV